MCTHKAVHNDNWSIYLRCYSYGANEASCKADVDCQWNWPCANYTAASHDLVQTQKILRLNRDRGFDFKDDVFTVPADCTISGYKYLM